MDDIDRFLEEDLGDEGDITTDSIFINEQAKAIIVANEDCTIAGLEETEKVFKKTGAKTDLLVKDGDFIKKDTIVAEIAGPIKSILKGERLALNFIGKMSGIASETKKLVDKCKVVNKNVNIAATRKTTPGFRKYEKKAVILGGGDPHRYGLFDAVMIKDNHIKCVGSIEKAINIIKKNVRDKLIEIEVDNEEDAIKSAELKVDVIMLDNFDPDYAEYTAKKIKQIDKDILLEISGGVNFDNIIEYASFADRISLGYITHSISSKDFSLNII